MGHVVRIGSVKRSSFRQRGASPAESAPRQKRTSSTTHAPQSIRIQSKIHGWNRAQTFVYAPRSRKNLLRGYSFMIVQSKCSRSSVGANATKCRHESPVPTIPNMHNKRNKIPHIVSFYPIRFCINHAGDS